MDPHLSEEEFNAIPNMSSLSDPPDDQQDDFEDEDSELMIDDTKQTRGSKKGS